MMGIGSELDLLPTFARLANATVPGGRTIDGHDLSATLTKGAPSPRETVFYYNGARLTGVRHRAFKLHLAVAAGSGATGARRQSRHRRVRRGSSTTSMKIRQRSSISRRSVLTSSAS